MLARNFIPLCGVSIDGRKHLHYELVGPGIRHWQGDGAAGFVCPGLCVAINRGCPQALPACATAGPKGTGRTKAITASSHVARVVAALRPYHREAVKRLCATRMATADAVEGWMFARVAIGMSKNDLCRSAMGDHAELR